MLYKIKQGDCLSLIAERFNTTPEALAKLNSEQIKHLDLIYEDNVLTISQPEVVETDGSRIAFVKAPTEMNGGNDTCEGKRREWADILYVPSHPKTGERMWYAISEFAKTQLLEEKAAMTQGINPDDAKATLQHLNRLGVLSKFSAKTHEQFMSEVDRTTYRTLLLTKAVITTQAYGKQKANDFLLSAAALVNIDLEASRTEIAEDEEAKNRTIYLNFSNLYHGRVEEKSQQAQAYFNHTVDQQLRALVLKRIDEEVTILEQAAEKLAASNVSEDGSHFVYVKSLEYFTTQKEHTLYEYVGQYRQAREALKTDDEIALSSHEEARTYVEAWGGHLNSAFDELVSIYGDTDSLMCASALRYLNQHGLVVKEQSLRLDQLEGTSPRNQGPKAFEPLSWRESVNGRAKPLDIKAEHVVTAIKALYEELQGPALDVSMASYNLFDAFNHINYDWSYYPTKALILVIDATLETHQSALTELFGGHKTPFDELFRWLLWIKKVALARLDALKYLAQEKAEKGAQGMRFLLSEANTLPVVLTSLWDESAFKPKPISQPGFINQAKFNDIQVVECSLLSDGKVFYVRGPQWYLPENEGDCRSGFHVKVLTKHITFEDVNSSAKVVKASNIKEAVEALSEPNMTVGLLPIIQQLESTSSFWQDSYHIRYKDKTKVPSYSVDAGAQFLRFVTQSEQSLNQPLESYQTLIKKPTHFGTSGTASANLTALQGQIGFTCWLPARPENKDIPKFAPDKVKDHELIWDWIDKNKKRQTFELGHFSACIAGSVYGLAAASCQLSSKVEFGPTSVDDGFGIKGNTVGLFDANVHDAYGLDGGDLRSAERAKIASEASMGVNVFAGIKAGGKLGAEVYWRAPVDKAPRTKLGSIDGELSASYGIGANTYFELKLQGNLLLLIASAGVVVGSGGSGKMAIALDSEATDTLLHHLLSLLKRKEFRRLDVFGEVDQNGENASYALLNDVMTVAIATGLTIGSALLIPTEMLRNFKKQTLSKDYAPAIAKRVLVEQPEEQAIIQAWVEKLPPETLCNLLNCLVQHQDSNDQNYQQAQAIVQVMQWLADDDKEQNGAKQRQWKEALIAMGDLPRGEKNYPLEWQTYKEQWFRLASFVKEFGGQYNNVLENLFNRSSKKLCGNMVLTKVSEYRRESTGFVFGVKTSEYVASQYAAYPINSVANGQHVGEKAMIALETSRGQHHWQLTQTEEEITEWSIANVL
ncbi:hypothetical protein PO80_02560 [Vibrio parahaemolyticus]|uniref:LysM peptidoglycan-binding domain-containing protein n=1 Tax=Vibrio parahaemolyticus TaxID=670 RepID=UPI000543B40C|nr:LysM domain-containing protein [Vibrio parahaemolyticus]ELU8562368.1 LysM peptidoglycan-binding domain-containing protein [Vibrio parahaemolyticus]KHF17402.1 hypothetical protein PO80_02560 [Vibrio parahaemolyticus]OTV96549.1 hypothetical protein BA739_23230 [Vibrio parahaemolyticus]OTV99063.1 hypothetical protein BA740_24415 [Vibrio parahaemolyticus]